MRRRFLFKEKKMKYAEWLNEWLEYYVKPTKKERTYYKYCSIVINHLSGALGNYGLDELTAPVLQRFVAGLTNKYSSNTVMGVIAVIKNSLSQAQDTGVVIKQSIRRRYEDRNRSREKWSALPFRNKKRLRNT